MTAIKIYKEYTAREVGVNGALLSASPSTNAIPMQGCNQLRFCLRVLSGGALTVTAAMQQSVDGTTWSNMTTKSILAGVETLSARTISMVVGAGTTRETYATGFDGNYFRLANITAAGATTETVWVEDLAVGRVG